MFLRFSNNLRGRNLAIRLKFTESRALKDKKFATAETRDPQITYSARKLEDQGKGKLSIAIPLSYVRANQIKL